MPPTVVLVLAAPDYEDLELHYPKLRLQEAGWDVKVAGLGERRYFGRRRLPCDVDGDVGDYPAGELAGVVVPGGWAPDRIRRAPEALALLRAVEGQGKLVAAIGHGASVLVSAGLLRGRRATSAEGIRDDLVHAGADWIASPVVVDGNVITAASDLPAFGHVLVDFLERWKKP
ncbi:MAG: DJ-1/PfpI family protein [Myxococcota bacterium]